MQKEIFSSCCAFGGGTEEVHALKRECPIGRELGSRMLTDREEVTCIYSSGISGIVIPPCNHYEGTKVVTRNKKKAYKIFCKALELPKASGTTEYAQGDSPEAV